MQKKIARQNKGITLVALVITIIVLIILAGVSISMILGNNGIISKADEGSQNMQNAMREEQEGLKYLENYIENNGESGTVGGNPNVSSYHNGVPIPKGFYYVGGEAETGLVISDNPNDANLGVGQTNINVELQGNQFVWIPVEVEAGDTETNIVKFKRNAEYVPSGAKWTSYSEPWKGGSVSAKQDTTGEYEEYSKMYKSVYENGGFYVGRYEAGCEKERTNTNKATSECQGNFNPVVVQKGKYVYNFVPWGKSSSSIEPASEVKGAVELSRGMYTTTDAGYGVVSHLIYGVQWDAVMSFVEDASHSVTDSRAWGNYSDSIGSAKDNSGTL